MKSRNRSHKRDAILAMVRSTTDHPTAEWVYHQLKPEIPDLSLATVYRNLTLFKEDGTIKSVGAIAGQERFDGNLDTHGHFVCDSCHAVIDIHVPVDSTHMMTQVESCKGFKVERFNITMHGSCQDCVQ